MTRYFSDDIAVKYGVNEAIVLSFIDETIKRTSACPVAFDILKNEDGRIWVRISDKEQEFFSFWPLRKVFHIAESLADINVIDIRSYGDGAIFCALNVELE